MKKQCSKCKLEKDAIYFTKDKRTKSGLYSACKQCHKKYIDNWRLNNKKKYNKTQKEWKGENNEKMKKYQRKWQKKRKLEPKFHLDSIVSTMFSKILKGQKAGQKWYELFDYKVEEMIRHFENKFDDKMTWENYGSYWSVDHVQPKSSFKYETAQDSEFKKCWALKNLQPLESIANKEKGKKLSTPTH